VFIAVSVYFIIDSVLKLVDTPSYALSNIVRVIKSKSVRWAWDVAHMGKIRNANKILVGKSEGKKT
jgi:hypothetical protein